MSRSSNPMDNFEYLRAIGKGSYGEVSLYRHKRDRKQYVLKRINLAKASKKERSSAEQEAKLLSKLKHPNIVAYKDSFERDGQLHIAMQFCEGGDVYTKLKEQKQTLLEERQVVEWFVQIAMALQYMHERNILHRDLKTQNIFLTKSKIIKVGDLGIARVLDSSTDMATTLIGTPYYMSPELFSNKPYNHKSDVWALGCCVYEMATLKHAFNGRDMQALVYKILKGRMPPLPKKYSPELQQIIRNMLHQEPERRPTVSRILRDPYIKRNIAVFLEETKKGRPSTAGQRRPVTAPEPRPRPDNSAAIQVGKSVQVSRHIVHVPGEDNLDSGPSANKNIIVVEKDTDPQVQPVPAPLRKHARKPSNGANKDLPPIAEVAKPVEAKKKLDSSSESSDNDTLVEVHHTVKEVNDVQKPVSPKKKKESALKKRAREAETESSLDTDRSDISVKSNASAKSDISVKSDVSSRGDASSSKSSHKKNIFKNHFDEDDRPKKVDNPRPLPPPPKLDHSSGEPQKRPSFSEEKHSNGAKSSSTGTSSSKEEDLDINTPRSCNLSARERRREKEKAAQSLERPVSARSVVLKPVRQHESNRETKAEKNQRESAHPRVQVAGRHKRIPSMKDDSSSSEEETMKESNEFKRENKRVDLSDDEDEGSSDPDRVCNLCHSGRRENKEMNNFITLLDTTLHMNREDDKSDDEEDKKEPVPPAHDIHRSASLPSVETLCNADRLTSRIQLLHKDCVDGVGFDVLHKSFTILSNIEEDEVEPQLIQLMGKEKFDIYAGKIWQLKFCEECFEQLSFLPR
ncbi:serine/threonine-protein kinase Nek4-like isoform X3 [Mytilus californianus]|uniref:serine/threonine-protein kinase Nek4-like isoform X3 n=1 Tax=Mytilus californianus TaxID=6549 RepID=UPI002247E963|nr:serine/threonine-protein kinase Nek4-like isoform X3 [Mytilus californianus]